MKNLDFLAVGDIVTDAFIELEDAWIETDNPEKSKELCMRFGDKIPYKDVVLVPAVGNSPNAGVSAHRLGLNSGLLTDLGDDSYGKEMIEALKKEGVSSEYVRIHKGKKSNYHFVLRFKAERTILVKHTEYDYADIQEIPSPKWLYLSSLASNSLSYHEMLANYLEKNPEIRLAFQPGTFQMKLGHDKLSRLYKLSHLFFCNKEEANRILGTKENDIKVLLKKMRELGPKIAIITDGPNGAYAYDGEDMWQMPMYPDPSPPVDRTGAGDSFSSTVTSALALGKTLPEALSWGPINSMSVVQYIGAQAGLLTQEKLLEYLKNAPTDYRPTKM
ncbi:MAG: carbohydrate kinase family protein [Bacteroidetes bacterium]|nr:carbohydrate kinase family protein [Bacteroidota bacterium]